MDYLIGSFCFTLVCLGITCLAEAYRAFQQAEFTRRSNKQD